MEANPSAPPMQEAPPQPPPANQQPPPGYSTMPAPPPAAATANQIVMQYAAPPAASLESYHGRQSVILGAVQIVCGVVAIIFQAVAIYAETQNNYRYQSLEFIFSIPFAGVWNGVAFILTGSFGIAAGKRKTKCLVITFLVLAVVFAFLFDLFLIGWDGAALASARHLMVWDCQTTGNEYNWNRSCKSNPLQVASLALCVISGTVFFLSMIWVMVITCSALCCRQNHVNTRGHVMYVHGGVPSQHHQVAPQPGQSVIIIQGQPAPNQGAPVVYAQPQGGLQQMAPPQVYSYPPQDGSQKT